MDTIKNILHYLKDILDYDILFLKHNILNLTTFLDANYERNKDIRYSINNIVNKIRVATIGASNKLQTTLLQFTSKVEYRITFLDASNIKYL